MALRRAWVLPLTPIAVVLQSQLREGARSRPLRAAIGFGYTLVFTAVTLLLAVVSARLVDQMRTDSRNRSWLG